MGRGGSSSCYHSATLSNLTGDGALYAVNEVESSLMALVKTCSLSDRVFSTGGRVVSFVTIVFVVVRVVPETDFCVIFRGLGDIVLFCIYYIYFVIYVNSQKRKVYNILYMFLILKLKVVFAV